jgi:hypothetical protein
MCTRIARWHVAYFPICVCGVSVVAATQVVVLLARVTPSVALLHLLHRNLAVYLGHAESPGFAMWATLAG